MWLDQDHRRHAVVELCIRDLKAGVGLRHCPSGKLAANAAWLAIATLAHNLLRWVAAIGLGAQELVVAKTLRRTLLAFARPADPLRPPADRASKLQDVLIIRDFGPQFLILLPLPLEPGRPEAA